MKTIERLKQLLAKATPGPWHIDGHDCPDVVRAVGGGGVLCGSYHDANVGTANVELAKASRNALPALLAVVEAAERFRELTERDDDDLVARFDARGKMFVALRALEGGE